MTVGELRALINGMPDDIEIVGDFHGSQDEIWRVVLGRINNDGIYEMIEERGGVPQEEVNLMICLG
ncbi:MAG: hypothetical protein GY931_21365 [Maribacter sp.]|nr:hypothetical protein [Maribacter sp.]